MGLMIRWVQDPCTDILTNKLNVPSKMLLFRDPKDGGTLKIDVLDNKLHLQPITKKVKDVAKVPHN